MFKYWQEQKDGPLFPDLEWSIPENKSQWPRIVIVGGSNQGIANTIKIYESSIKQGSINTKVLLPDSYMGIVPNDPNIIFSKASKHSSHTKDLEFNIDALEENTDVFVVSEDIGKESEALLAVERLVSSSSTDYMIIGSALISNDYNIDSMMFSDKKITIVCSKAILQQFVSRLPVNVAISSSDGVVDIIKKLHEITSSIKNMVFVVVLDSQVVVAEGGEVYSQKTEISSDSLVGIIVNSQISPLAKNYINSLHMDK